MAGERRPGLKLKVALLALCAGVVSGACPTEALGHGIFCEMGIWPISIVSVKVDGELDPALMSLPGGWPAEQELRGFPQYVFLSGLREESRLKLEPAFCDTGYWCD